MFMKVKISINSINEMYLSARNYSKRYCFSETTFVLKMEGKKIKDRRTDES